jgi:multiple sugar transport system permease protein
MPKSKLRVRSMSNRQRKSPSSGSIVRGAAASAAAPTSPSSLSWKRRHQLTGLFFLLPAVIYVAIFYVYPIVLNVTMSFQRYTARSFVTGEAPFIGFRNFDRLFSNPDFTVALQNTLVFTLGSLIFQFVIGLALAVFFNQKFPLGGLLRSLFLLPWLAPILVSGAVWVRLFDLDYGVINYVLRSLGLIQEPLAWLIDPHLAPISVLIANIWIGIPFNMVILYGGLQNIPNTLYEAAMIDGAGAWQKFRYVTWPLLRSVSTVVLLLGLIYTLKVFDVIMSITRGGPANVSQTLNTWAYSLSFISLDFGLGAAAGDILMLVVLGFGLIYLRYAMREER